MPRSSVPSQDALADLTSQGSSVGIFFHPIFLTRQGFFDGLDLYVGTTSLTTYATGNGDLLVGVRRNSMTAICLLSAATILKKYRAIKEL